MINNLEYLTKMTLVAGLLHDLTAPEPMALRSLHASTRSSSYHCCCLDLDRSASSSKRALLLIVNRHIPTICTTGSPFCTCVVCVITLLEDWPITLLSWRRRGTCVVVHVMHASDLTMRPPPRRWRNEDVCAIRLRKTALSLASLRPLNSLDLELLHSTRQ